ncbi:Uncharacterised protein [uncultured archaeon]|nr:Uncharacterised protein [uncultured archaeon]
MEEEKREHEQEHSHEHHKKNLTNHFRENPWVLSTLICGVLVAVLLISTVTGGLTGNISSKAAGEKLLKFYQSVGIENLSVDSVKQVSGLYEVDLSYKGKIIPVYITKDGKSFTESLTPTGDNSPSSSNSNSNTQTTVPKSDKPKVELYVFAYCPYGTQMEKAMIPAVKLLGDKIDFTIRQIGAMHGDFEKVEAQRQLCIDKNYPDKYLDYVLAFDSDSTCSTGDASCVATKTGSIFSKLGIDASKINSCMTSDGLTMYNSEISNANSKGVSGSPTLIINGVTSQADRSPEGVKGAICSAFNNVPSECSQKLDTNQASPGFGSGTGSSSNSAAACATQ